MFAGENTDERYKKKTANEDERRYERRIQKRVQEHFTHWILIARRKFNSLMKIAVVIGLLSALHGPQYCHLALNILYGDRWANSPGATTTLGRNTWSSSSLWKLSDIVTIFSCRWLRSYDLIPGSERYNRSLRACRDESEWARVSQHSALGKLTSPLCVWILSADTHSSYLADYFGI